MSRDARVDAYIAKSADFARPILEHIRAAVHAACPEVVETIKWGMPFFDHQGPMCHMAAFKSHCAMGFWKGSMFIEGAAGADEKEAAMGQFGRLASIADLPDRKTLKGYLKQAVSLNEAGTVRPRSKTAKPPLEVPDDLKASLEANPKALAVFDAFTPGRQREYVEWLLEAKTDATRQKRLATAAGWIAEGKVRNWKYAS